MVGNTETLVATEERKEICAFSKSLLGRIHKQMTEEYKAEGKSWKFKCQDASYSEEIAKGCFLTVVCDGHGHYPHFRSDKGSSFGVEAVKDVVSKVLENLKSHSVTEDWIRENIIKAIVEAWREKVSKDFGEISLSAISADEWQLLEDFSCIKEKKEYEQAVSEKRFLGIENDKEKKQGLYSIYGTTLLAVLSLPKSWIAIQIGDGTIVLRNKEKFFSPFEYDNKELGTESIYFNNAANIFKIQTKQEPLMAVLCASDGLLFKNMPQQYFWYARNVLRLFHDYDGSLQINTGEKLREYVEKT